MSDANDVVRREALERTITARLLACSLDELRVLDFVLGRLEVGRDRYGLLDLGDPRRRSLNYKRERAEEVADAIVYTAFDAIIEHDKRVEAIIARADETPTLKSPVPHMMSAWTAAVESARSKLADRILHEPANQTLAERIHRRAGSPLLALTCNEVTDTRPVDYQVGDMRVIGTVTHRCCRPAGHAGGHSAMSAQLDLSDVDDAPDLPSAIAADLTRGGGRVPSPEVVAFGHAMASADDEVAPPTAIAEICNDLECECFGTHDEGCPNALVKEMS